METLRSNIQLEEMFVPSDSISEERRLIPKEPHVRPLSINDVITIMVLNSDYPDVRGFINTWEDGLTPIGWLDNETLANVSPQEIYDQEQQIKQHIPGEPNPYPVGSVLNLAENWHSLTNCQKQMCMTVVDAITGEIIDTTGIIEKKYPKKEDKIEGVIFDNSEALTSGSVSLTHA